MSTTKVRGAGWAPRVERVLRQVYVVFVVAAFLPQLRLVSDAAEARQAVLLGCVLLMLAVGFATWFWPLTAWHRGAVALAFVAAATVEVTESASTGADTTGAYLFFVGVMLMTALSGEPLRYAVVAAVAGLVYAVGRVAAQGSGVWLTAVDEVIAATTTCAAFTFLVRGLRVAADHADRSTAMASQVGRQRDLASQRLRHAEETRRVLHDEVIAALAAVDVAGAADPGSARAAADRALAALDGDVFLATLDDLDLSSYGIPSTEVFVDPDVRSEGTPDEVFAAISGAVAEALRNVSRHAGVDAATVHVTADGDGFVVTVRDEGAGFAADAVEGFGLTSSVRGRMHEVGGSVEVESAPGSGTSVVLTWRPTDLPATRWERSFWTVDVAAGVRSLIGGALVWFIAGQTWMALRYIPEDRLPVAAGLVLAAILVQNVVVIRRVTARPLTWTPAVLAVLSSVALMGVGLWAAGPGALRGFESWMVGSAEPALMALAVVASARFALAASAVYAAGVAVVGVLDPTLAPWDVVAVTIQNPIHVATIALVAFAIRRIGRAGSAQDANLGRAAMSEEQDLGATVEQERQVDQLRAAITPFLDDVRSGRAATASAEVRSIARRLAAWVRDELHLPGLLDASARAEVDAARDRGALVELRLDDVESVDASVVRGLVGAVAPLVPVRGQLVVTASARPGEVIGTVRPPVDRSQAVAALGPDARVECDELVTWIAVSRPPRRVTSAEAALDGPSI